MISKGRMSSETAKSQLQRNPIAIIGMASVFPQARKLRQYWDNIIREVDCITDVPASRWDVADYYDPDPTAPDKTYSKRGGFIPDIDFNPMEFGIPPNILEATDISQLLALVVAKEALENSGYSEDSHAIRERTGVVLGVGVGRQLGISLSARLQYPIWERVLKNSGLSEADTKAIVEKIKLAYVSWQENSFPGALGNVVAGRVANRLNLGGVNCVVDAACASSLGAVKMAVSELIERRSDMMITGGVDTDNSIMMYMCFSKTPAFTQHDNMRPFDTGSDGMMVGEGIGMLVLRRLEDAERDNDKIYAVIRGLGTSSDGRYKSIYAPRAEGQVKALRRAYRDAGVPPSSVGLIEAHGTGTAAGDPAEVEALNQVFGEDNPARRQIALGSVKSQIGHTKAAAGAASMIKAVLALHHKVLPPTINITRPNPKLTLDSGPLYLNTTTRPWFRHPGAPPRRAGVSSFGFGGTNFHLVLEEYEEEHQGAYRLHSTAEPILLVGETPEQLLAECEATLAQLRSDAAAKQFAQMVETGRKLQIPARLSRIGFVADSIEQAREMLEIGIRALQERRSEAVWQHPKGIYFRQAGIAAEDKVVALFSGQGSQYVGMGRELAVNMPELRQAFSTVDALYIEVGMEPVSSVVFPAPAFEAEELEAQEQALRRTAYAQPAIGALSLGLYKILHRAGLQPDFVAGHSFGELTALWAAGILQESDYFTLVKARGLAMAPPDQPQFDAGAMLAVAGDVERIQQEIAGFPEVRLANLNSSNQAVLAGDTQSIEQAQSYLIEKGYSARRLPVSAAFHTPLVKHAQRPFAEAIGAVRFHPAQIPVYSNSTGERYPDDLPAMQSTLQQHILEPVLFKQEIENLHAAGGRCFVEFGPKSILSNLVKSVLQDKPHEAVALNANAKADSDRQLREAALQLRVIGIPLGDIDPHRAVLDAASEPAKAKLSIRLNANTYVSDETKAAFENALRDGHRVSAPEEGHARQLAADVAPVEPTAEASRPATPDGSLASRASTSSSPSRSTRPVVHPQLLESLRTGLEKFADHQAQSSRLHEQFLNTQREYAQTFSQLMQAQSALLSDGNLASESAEALQMVLEALGKGMQEFHRHQDETVRLHEQYLKSQSEFSKTFADLLNQERTEYTLGDELAQPAASDRTAWLGAEKPDPSIQPSPPQTPALPSQPAVPDPEAGRQRAASTGVKADRAAVASAGREGDGAPAPAAGADGAAAPTVGPGADDAPAPAAEADGAAAPTVGPGAGDAPAPAAGADGAAAALPAVHGTPASQVEVEEIATALLEVVSEKTGYPPEVIELEMDLEADLGIDSIKRVEILGAMQQRFAHLPKLNPDELTELRTLGQIIDYIKSQAPAAGADGTAVASVGQEGDGAPDPAAKDDGAAAPTVGPATDNVPVPAAKDDGAAAPTVGPGADDAPAPTAKDDGASAPTTGGVPATGANGEADRARAPAAKEPAGTQTVQPANRADLDATSNTLLQVMSKKTGYPVETLEAEMELEADLGIDAINMIGILGAWRESLAEPPALDLEKLARRRTLGQVIEAVARRMPAASSSNGLAIGGEARSPEHRIERAVVRVTELPSPDALDVSLALDHCCVLTDDGTPTTVELAGTLRQRGWPVVVLRFPGTVDQQRPALPEGIHRIALSDWGEAELKQQLQAIADRHGSVGAFVHLHAPGQELPEEGIPFLDAERDLVKHVFLLAKHLKGSLTGAAQNGRSWFVTVSRLDGKFGLGQEAAFGVVGAGLPGLTKTISLEWPSVFCRALDLSPDLDAEQSAARIVAELHDPNRLLTEVGYGDEDRCTLRYEEASRVDQTAAGETGIDASSVFVVSGGAKGITARCVVAMAQRYRCGFILLGRTSIERPEPASFHGLSEEADLKKRILDDLVFKGQTPTPAQIEKVYREIVSKREIEATLSAIEAVGGRARYASVDITDRAALQSGVEAAVQELGPVTGLIHGAGNLADKWIERKSEQDFEVVYSTKVDGLRNLLECLPAEELDYLVMFSSTAAVFGNVGQADYALANEVLNKTAHSIRRQHPSCRAIVINWGPWDGGMVSPELKKIFAMRNIDVIPFEMGTKMFLDELDHPNHDTAQVVISSPVNATMLAPETGEARSEPGDFRIRRKVALEANPFLLDHTINGQPVLPFACAAGWMINACEQLHPGWTYFSLLDFQLLKGILPTEIPGGELILDLEQVSRGSSDAMELKGKIWSEDEDGRTRYHYRGRVKLLRGLPEPLQYESYDLSPAQDEAGQAYYRQGTLFHGSSLQGVDRVLNLSRRRATLRCQLPRLEARQQGQFPARTFNPYTTDIQFHGALIWTDHFTQEGCLPTRSPRFEQFAPVPFDAAFYVSMEVRSKTETSLVVDVFTHDDQGQLYNQLLGFEATVSKKLYRSFK